MRFSASDPAPRGKPLPQRSGRGVSLQSVFGTYIAQVAEIEVGKDGAVRVRRVVCAVDCGSVVNPDTIQAQIEGAVIFGISAALYGQVTVKGGRIEQSNFHDYKVLRMSDAPAIETYIIRNTASQGASASPVPAQSCPSLPTRSFAATGKRLQRLPVDRAQLRQA